MSTSGQFANVHPLLSPLSISLSGNLAPLVQTPGLTSLNPPKDKTLHSSWLLLSEKDNFLLTFRVDLSFPSSGVKIPNVRIIRCHVQGVNNPLYIADRSLFWVPDHQKMLATCYETSIIYLPPLLAHTLRWWKPEVTNFVPFRT
jgi:hypothetical protein